MSTAKSWNVRPSRFPFGVSVEIVGVVSGADRADAQQKAEDLYGRDVVVELQHAGSNSPERNRLSRQNGMPAGRLADRSSLRMAQPLRDMTADEAQMARAASCCPMIAKSEHRARIRMLHARSLTANRTITEHDGRLLRAVVIAFKSQIDPQIVALAEGAR